jgi:FkbM family methyltransferase
VPGAREWIGKLLLRSPASFRSVRDMPLIGNVIHRLSYRVLPVNEKVWAQVEAGPARGLWLELNPRTGQGYISGEAEPKLQKILAERLHPGMVFYDLGANIGLFSLLAARLVGAEGRVFSFEPDAQVAARLRGNVARNGFSNITVVEAGVWSESKNVSFIAAGSSSPDRGTGRFVAEDRGDSTALRCVALDDFIETAPLPDAIKCDVEGAELEALHGAEQLLKAHRPWILCEMHSEGEGNDRASRELLGRIGYRIESVDGNHVLAVP